MLVGYARVSTAGQSLDVQLDQLRQAGCEKIFQEKASGVRADRPELATMLDFVREGDHVICCKLDRIARSTRHLLEIVDSLEAKEVGFRVLNLDLDTKSPAGRLMLTLLGGMAAFEREMMLERQSEGIQRAKREGKYKGRKPTARAKAPKVLALAAAGVSPAEISRQTRISPASVYRILAENRG